MRVLPLESKCSACERSALHGAGTVSELAGLASSPGSCGNHE